MMSVGHLYSPATVVRLLVASALAQGCVRQGFDLDASSGHDLVLGDVQPGDGRRERPGDLAVPDGAGVPGSWVAVSAGTYTIGSPASEACRLTDEEQHAVTLTRGFELQTTEVTQGQFAALMGYNPSSFTACGESCPVETVSWHEAAAYCNALSARSGRASCYSCTGSGSSVACDNAVGYAGQQIYACPGYRLPTEAEWERAYRAGTTTPYYSGTHETNRCSSCATVDPIAERIGWYCALTSTTRPVGQKPANPLGLFDMGGNVWEWCQDFYQQTLGSAAVIDPWGPGLATHRSTRGGSWMNYSEDMRAADRHPEPIGSRRSLFGFRCARSLP